MQMARLLGGGSSTATLSTLALRLRDVDAFGSEETSELFVVSLDGLVGASALGVTAFGPPKNEAIVRCKLPEAGAFFGAINFPTVYFAQLTIHSPQQRISDMPVRTRSPCGWDSYISCYFDSCQNRVTKSMTHDAGGSAKKLCDYRFEIRMK